MGNNEGKVAFAGFPATLVLADFPVAFFDFAGPPCTGKRL